MRVSGLARLMGAAGLLLAAGALPTVHASTRLYRCVGAQGEAVFTSHADGYRRCHRLDEPGVPPSLGRRPGLRRVTATVLTVAAGTPTRPSPLSPRHAPQAPPVLRGAVYRVRRADGSVEYTNLAPATASGGQVVRLFTYIVTCMACSLHSPIDWRNVPLQLADYAGPIQDASRRFGVDPALLRAVIHAESAFNPRAISLKGAQGLMQLMPATAGELGVADAFDASQNIHAGARYLARLLLQFHGDVGQAAAAYNAGAAAVLRYGGVPPFAETRIYVQRVELLFHRYRAQLPRHLD